jgi:arginyl-tRNA synthetase
MKYKYFPYDHSVVSTSNEITEYFKVLKQALSLIAPELAEKTEHIGHGTVRLTEGKMSSRTGNVIAALDFIGEIKAAVALKMAASPTTETSDDDTVSAIAIGAIKYATLRANVFQDNVFNKEQALSFEGDSGPYLQYTHARIGSVEDKAAKEGVVASLAVAPSEPYAVEKLLYRFPEIVEKALRERQPHHVATFLIELAGSFNTFYAKEKIADASDEFAPYKLALAGAIKTTLKNGLWLLGIAAPEKM